MKRHKVINITEDRIDYYYEESEVKLLIEAVKGILSERVDPRNADRYLSPVIHYVTEDCETTVWARVRELVEEFENGLTL